MSFLFGGGQKTKPQYTGVQVQTSSSVLPVPLAYGMSRGAPNLIDYLDFQSHKHKVGKGGGAKGGSTYTYSATVLLALCCGTIEGIGQAWLDDGTLTDYSSLGFDLFTGTIPQSPWGYLTSAHPDHADPYNGLAYLAKQNYDLGSSAGLPNQNFEVKGLLFESGVDGAVVDADPALLIQDFLTEPDHGALFPESMLDLGALLSGPDATTTGDAAYQTYCRAMGFALSPFLAQQAAAGDTVSNWCLITNTAPVWTGFSLKFVPYGDATITANGVTYLPDLTVRFSIGDDDYFQNSDGDPLQATRSDPADAYNVQKLNVRDRSNAYNEVPINYQNDNAMALYGRSEASLIDGTACCDTTMGAVMVDLIGQRILFVRNQYLFTLDDRYCVLEPMDLLQVSDPRLGTLIAVRLVEIEEQDDDTLQCTAEEFTGIIGTPGASSGSSTVPNPINSRVDPGDVNVPWIGEPPSTLAGKPQVWAAVSGGVNWGGAHVWASRDGTSFEQIGDAITMSARQGVTTSSLAAFSGANPDTTHSVGVDLSESQGELDGVSAADAAASATLSVISNADYTNAEFFAFRDATLTGANAYTLGGQLYRALYSTTGSLHASGSLYARLDTAIFQFDLPPDYIGVPLWFKFTSFNLWQTSEQDLSAVTAYTYTPTGAGFGGGAGGVPIEPTGVSATGGDQQAVVSWTLNPLSDNVTAYDVYRAPGSGASFGAAVLIASVAGSPFTDLSLAAASSYTYFVAAKNSIGDSSPSAGANATTSAAAASGVVRFYGGFDGKPPAALKLFEVELKGDEKFPAGLSGSLLGADVAATAASQLLIKVNGSNVGHGDFAIGATTGTFTLASAYNASAGDKLAFFAPATPDATLASLTYTFIGTRT